MLTKIAQIKKDNENLQESQKTKYHIKKQELYINNNLQQAKITPPGPADIFNLEEEEKDDIMAQKFVDCTKVVDRKSVFKSYTKRVNSLSSVRKAYLAVKIMHPEADHIMVVYNTPEAMGYCDDGEHFAGQKLERFLKETAQKNIVIFVTREYGNFHLGVHHFTNILKVAKEATDLLLQEETSK